MDCSECKKLLSSYLDGELSDEESAAVAKHLEDCSECGRAMKEMQAVDHVTRQSVELNLPGKGFSEKVMREIPSGKPGLSRWQGPIAFAVLALLTAGILLGIRHFRKGGGGPGPGQEKDLQHEIVMVTSAGETRLTTPVTVKPSEENGGPGALKLPYGAQAVFDGEMEIRWTRSGVHLTPSGRATVYCVTPEILLREVYVHVPGDRLAGKGKAFALEVDTAGGRWSLYGISGETKVGDRNNENPVVVAPDHVLADGMNEQVRYGADEIAAVLQPLCDWLPARPLLPYWGGVFEKTDTVLELGGKLDTQRPSPAYGAGETAVGAMSVIGPPSRDLLLLRREGGKCLVVEEGRERPVELPEDESPCMLAGSPQLGLIILTEKGNVYLPEYATGSKDLKYVQTGVEKARQVCWRPYSGMFFVAGPGGVAAFDTSTGVAAWTEKKLKDVAGMAMDDKGRLVCATRDGAVTILEGGNGKLAHAHSPMGQAIGLPPITSGGITAVIGERGRVLVLEGDRSDSFDIAGVPGVESWGMRAGTVYLRYDGQWYGYDREKNAVSHIGAGGSWAVLGPFGLVRMSAGAVYRGGERLGTVRGPAHPVLMPDGLLVLGEKTGFLVPYGKTGE
ncbi:MAG: zf-HC2 domain-containing protein [Planctomycetes bacterium]|nr:zf-HC2 domain-containing protein [Planctomycetota bacterium]